MESTCFFLLLAFLFKILFGNNNHVQIQEGTVVGTRMHTRYGRNIHAFIGIPYAEPAVGDLRFRDPLPKNGWQGVLNAQNPGNVCLQYSMHNEIIGSEDCLVLNVYTPRLHSIWKALLPVMVFVHGGSFIIGEGGPNLYSPSFLLDKDIILVTINYRLSIFGFLSTGDRISPGNYGLKDQRLAFQWVHRNIHAFGGDPNRVTLFGHSVGSTSISIHALSEKSQPYFQQYILESGYSTVTYSCTINPIYFDYATLTAAKLNCPTTNTSAAVECLRHRPTKELFVASNIVAANTGIHFWPSIEPKYDNAVLTDTPANLIRQGKMMDVPVIVGGVRDEGLLVTSGYYMNDTMHQALRADPEREMRYILNYFEPSLRKNDTELAARCRRFYFGETLPADRNTLLERFTMLAGDYYFTYPYTLMRDSLRNSKHPVFVYLYSFLDRVSATQVATHNDDIIGVTHGDELYYVFDWNYIYNRSLLRHRTKSQSKMITLLVDFWTSFARDGAPTSKHLSNPAIWQPASQSNWTTYLQIGNNSDPAVTVKQYFLGERMQFWQKQISECPA